MSTFPHMAHRDDLKSKCRRKGHDGQELPGLYLEQLSREDRFFWHAYNYGFRRIALGLVDDKSPIDPERKWFDAELAAIAEAFWRPIWFPKSRPRAAFRVPSPPPHNPASDPVAATQRLLGLIATAADG